MFEDEDGMPNLHTMSQKMARVHRNGEMEGGKTLQVREEWNMDDLLNAAQQRLRLTSTPTRIFNSDGMEVTDVMMMEDNAIVFVSQGADFIPPMIEGEGGDEHDLEASGLPSVVGGYKVLDFLGKGGFGEVRVGEHQLTGEKVALKFLRKSDIADMGAAERTTTEIQCLTALKHPAIIRLVAHVNSPQYVVLVFELMEGGDMYHYLADLPEQRLDEDEARFIFHNVVSAVGYAHNQHICHRDLKLDNILLKQKKNLSVGVKIADFGLSDFYRPGATSRTNCGTLSYLAPEVFHGTSNAGPPLDVWAMGVILFALLCGRLPFEGTDFRSRERPKEAVIRQRILQCQYKVDDSLNVSPEARDLVRRMLKLDPNERASIPEVFNHCWLRARNQPSLDVHQQTNSTSSPSSSSSSASSSGPCSSSAAEAKGSASSPSAAFAAPPSSSSPSRPNSPRRLLRPLDRKNTSDESRDGTFGAERSEKAEGKPAMRRAVSGFTDSKDAKDEPVANGGAGRPLSARRRRRGGGRGGRERKEDSKDDGDSDCSDGGGGGGGGEGYSDSGSKEIGDNDKDGYADTNGSSRCNNSSNSDEEAGVAVDDDGGDVDDDENSFGGGEGRDFHKSHTKATSYPTGHVKSSRSVGSRPQGSGRILMGIAGPAANNGGSSDPIHSPSGAGGGRPGHNRLHLSATLPQNLSATTGSIGLEPIVSPRPKGGGPGSRPAGGSGSSGGGSSSNGSGSCRPMSRGGGHRELEPLSPRGAERGGESGGGGANSPPLSSSPSKHHYSITAPTLERERSDRSERDKGERGERQGRTSSDSEARLSGGSQLPAGKMLQQSPTNASKGNFGMSLGNGNSNASSTAIPAIHTSPPRERESSGGPSSLSPTASSSSTLPSLSPRSPPRKYK